MGVKKTKVESLDIIVTMMEDKPYYEIKYKEVGSDHFCIGYSSYRLDYVLEWKKQYFELVESEAGADQEWIPCSERLPDKAFGCLVTVMDGDPYTEIEFENVLPYHVGYDSGRWNDADGEEIPFEVIAWMPLPKPHREG